MSEKKLPGEIVTSYLERFPETPSLTLAKLIYKENPEVWSNVESVRNRIRYYRGSNGVKGFDQLADRRFIKEFGNYNPFELPESEEKEFKHFDIPVGFNKTLIIGDVHIPYHSIKALTLMLDFATKQSIDSILLNGDIIDFYALSCFVKDPRKRIIKEEIESLKKFLDVLEKSFNVKIFYKIGNHEERLETYLRVKAPELIGISEFELYNLLGLEDRNITLIKDKRTIKFGKLNILHGHELKSGIISPVNVARGVFLKTKVPTLVNHWHIKTSHGENSLNEKYIECWSVGCMCELHPEYMPNNRWVHGFAIVDKLNEEGEFNVNNFKIIKGRVFE